MNILTKSSVWLCALLLIAGACTSPSTTVAGEQDKNKSGSETPTDGKKPVPAPPDASSIPTELKHDGYAYNGFGRNKPLTYLFSKVQGDKPESGTQSSTLKEVKDGTAYFSVNRTGSLAAIGGEDLMVKADGVYLESTSLGSPKAPVKLMPSTVAPGTVWDYNYELSTSAGSKMSFKGKARVVQAEQLKVAAGSFDTILVSETAEMNNAGVKGTVSSKTWYAKDVGVVKMRMEVKDQSGKVVTSTIELSGTGG